MVHLNITLDEDIYRRLKQRVAPKKLSAFIAQTLRDRLGPNAEELEAAYREAAKEPWRKGQSQDWSVTEHEA